VTHYTSSVQVVEPEMEGARFAPNTGSVHNPTMTLKNAALLALIGTILMTALLVWTFVFNFLNLLRGLRRRFAMVFGGNESSLDEAIWSSLNVP